MRKNSKKPDHKYIDNDREASMNYKDNELLTALNYNEGTYTTEGVAYTDNVSRADDIFFIEHETPFSKDNMSLSLQEVKWLIQSLKTLVDEIEK